MQNRIRIQNDRDQLEKWAESDQRKYKGKKNAVFKEKSNVGTYSRDKAELIRA